MGALAKDEHSTIASRSNNVSSAMTALDELIHQVAGFNTLVLIRGESGSGKEVVARRIHSSSSRAEKPFVPVNCGAIPSDLLESELFGHEKGAFTGAVATRKGRFEMAEGGTLFLDEIGDMSLPMQVKLLRVLQERSFERVGSNHTQQCDVRILAATHRNLENMVHQGSFREDLFYRLDVFPIEVPALREHAQDVSSLMAVFMSKLEARGMTPPKFSASAMRALQQYPWPGNVRELENLMERLAITHGNKLLRSQDLPAKYQVLGIVERDDSTDRDDQDALLSSFSVYHADDDDEVVLELAANPSRPPLPDSGIDLKNYLLEIEQWFISEALRKEAGVITRAAQLLGLQRTTLAEKMKKLGVS